MKRIFATVLVLLTLLVLTTGTAFAGSALELVDVRNNAGGPTFIFRVTGEFAESELTGGVVSVEGGEDFPLYCAQTDADTVVCHTSKKIGGENVVVGFGGARFWTFMPTEIRCYPVYDWNLTGGGIGNGWANYGPYCQDGAAEDHQQIFFWTPPFGTSTYYYFTAGVDGFLGWENEGPGFYFYN